MFNKKICKSIPKNSKKIFGSGGSQTVIIITPKNEVYKFFIVFSRKDKDDKRKKKEMKDYMREINIQKYLTKNIVDKNISPHIARLKSSILCKSSPSFLFTKCPSFKKLLKTPEKKIKLPKECKYLISGHPIKIEKGFFIANIEYCPMTLGNVILQLMRKSNKTLKNNLNRLLFQIIYTLAIIQKKYPFFIHHDLFMRNILVKEYKCKKNDYFRYYFDKFTYDIPANGYMVKITDFGITTLDKKHLGTGKLIKSPYEDVFHIIRDIYHGQNLGAESCVSIARKRKNKKKERFLHNYFSKFINTKFLKEIEKNGQLKHIEWNWRMFYDPELAKLFKVKLPKEYLKHFVKIYPKNDNHNIIEEFGK